MPRVTKVVHGGRQWTRAELDREKDEFFDTRVTGREEIWATLKIVIDLLAEGNIATAQGILDASAITLPTGDLVNGAYDEAGNFYQIPEYIVGDPNNVIPASSNEIVKAREMDDASDEEELERRREEKGKGVFKNGELIKVKARLSDRGGPDLVISIPGKGRVKIAYLGRLFKEGETLLAQGWREGHVVNALVFQ
ncbi:MAG: hypothetical protein Q9195_006286 [Heterodermia aff. obscurata]